MLVISVNLELRCVSIPHSQACGGLFGECPGLLQALCPHQWDAWDFMSLQDTGILCGFLPRGLYPFPQGMDTLNSHLKTNLHITFCFWATCPKKNDQGK